MKNQKTDIFKQVYDLALFKGWPAQDIDKFVKYFFKVSKGILLSLVLRTHIIALYDPFADHSVFPAGIRFCVNIYVGCPHCCSYCYVRNYIRNSNEPRAKKDFIKKFNKDIEEIKSLNLPPIPIHLSNSTDPLQEYLENQYKHTLYTIGRIAENQKYFSVVTILTKNPAILLQNEYIDVLHKIQNLRIQLSLTFWDDKSREYYEPGAPSVKDRLNAITELRKHNFNVILRIDPLFPREPLPSGYFSHSDLKSYGIQTAHSYDDIKNLIDFAKNTGCSRIVVSPLKVVCGRFSDKRFSQSFYPMYQEANKGGRFCKGFAYRLPDTYVKEYLLGPVMDYCKSVGVEGLHCKHDLCTTK